MDHTDLLAAQFLYVPKTTEIDFGILAGLTLKPANGDRPPSSEVTPLTSESIERQVWNQDSFSCQELVNLGQQQIVLLQPLPDLITTVEKNFLRLTKRGRRGAGTLHTVDERSNGLLFRPRIAGLQPHLFAHLHQSAHGLAIETGRPSDRTNSIPAQPTTKHFKTIHDSNLPVWHAALLRYGMSYLLVESRGRWGKDPENGVGEKIGRAHV